MAKDGGKEYCGMQTYKNNLIDVVCLLCRVCGRSGEWEGLTPLCHPITCGQPPLVENSQVELVNASTTWLSLALFSCKAGYSNSIPGKVSRQRQAKQTLLQLIIGEICMYMLSCIFALLN